jgi:hypothetical protein
MRQSKKLAELPDDKLTRELFPKKVVDKMKK